MISLEDVVKPLGGLLDKWPAWRQLGLQTGDLSRLLRLECEVNRRLLDCLEFDNAKPASGTAEGYRLVAASLKTDALCLVLGHDDKAAKTFKQLARIPLLPEVDDELGPPAVDPKATVAQKLLRVYAAAVVCQRLASLLPSEGDIPTGIKNINLRTRLRNLRDAYVAISLATSGASD